MTLPAPSRPVLSRRDIVAAALAAATPLALSPGRASAASRAELDAAADEALKRLYGGSDKARELSAKSLGVLIFPKITKAGFVIGGQGGEGVLRIHGVTRGYYRIGAASFGLQAGAQTFSYALFFVTRSSLEYLRSSKGWAIGSGPSVVVADAGVAKSLNTTTLTQDVYAMPFGQSGLMAGLGLEGSKISRFDPKP